MSIMGAKCNAFLIELDDSAYNFLTAMHEVYLVALIEFHHEPLLFCPIALAEFLYCKVTHFS